MGSCQGSRQGEVVKLEGEPLSHNPELKADGVQWLWSHLAFSFLGYGLHCHRAIITICRLIGIKDMYAKVSGSVNMLNLTRGLFHALSHQVTLSQHLKQKFC